MSIKDLEEYCSPTNGSLSLEGLRHKLGQVASPSALAGSYFLHELCMHPNVALEMVESVLQLNPYTACFCTNRYWGNLESAMYLESARYAIKDFDGECNQNGEKTKRWTNGYIRDVSYPIHVACANPKCPGAIVRLLADRNPSALSHFCLVKGGCRPIDECDTDTGRPIFYYLGRSSNMDVSTVKYLVEAYPDCLTEASGYDHDSHNYYQPIHVLVENPTVGEHTDILRYLIKKNRDILRFRDSDDKLPLHMALDTNDYATAEVIKILVQNCSESVSLKDNSYDLPIHKLAKLEAEDNGDKAEILKILLKANPASVRRCSAGQNLAIHYAVRCQQPNFIRLLVNAYPESVNKRNEDMESPFYLACRHGSFETVKYLYGLYPESINARNCYGLGPVHIAARRDDPTLQVIKYLLDLDSDAASRAARPDPDGISRLWRPDDEERHIKLCLYNEFLPLHYASENKYFERGSLEAIKHLFDIYPEALFIKTNSARIMPPSDTRALGNFSLTPEGIARRSCHGEAARFLAQQVESLAHYKDAEFPIHSAIQDGQTLGVIKLLVTKWYEDHISLFDAEHNSPLHYACISGRIEVINYLLETQPVSGSGQNKDGKLPVEMLLEAAECGNRGSVEYTEAIWRLLVANPEALTGLLQ